MILKRTSLLVVLLLLLSGGLFAQENYGGGVDDELVHFGFTFQYVGSEFKIFKKPGWRTPVLGDIPDPNVPGGTMTGNLTTPLKSISSPVSPGFGLGLLVNLRMGENADLRFTPTFVFNDRLLNYEYEDPSENKQKKVSVTLIDMPLSFKLKSDRRKNFRAYVLGGVKYSMDIASKKKVNDEANAPIDKLVKNLKNYFSYEAGIGFDLYFEYFKMSPEIKFSQSFGNVLKPEDHPYSAPLDKLVLRHFVFSLYFE